MAVETKPVSHIRPMAPLFEGSKPAPTKTWSFDDQSKILFPKGRDGKSMRVTLIIRELSVVSEGSPKPTVFRAVKNAGKWSFKISYSRKDKPTAVKAETFFAELGRIGGGKYARLMVMPM